jgi:TatD DNase family protein
MEFIDTHAHLFLPEFDEDRSLVVERAINAGIRTILLPNIDKDTIRAMLELCETYPTNCYPMIGLHPTSVKEDFAVHLAEVEKYLGLNEFVAIGEVGIDLYWDKTYLAQQREAFVYQIDLARKHSLPLVIHSRDSFAEIVEILHQQYNGKPYSGVFHSFSGNLDQAREVVELGFKIGINGVVTFKNSTLGAVVKDISLDDILLETDAPYLTPVPHRGKRNESAYIPYIAGKISEIKGVSVEEVGKMTSQTAKILFKLN